jgi:Cu-Zn family superoxide dismutase
MRILTLAAVSALIAGAAMAQSTGHAGHAAPSPAPAATPIPTPAPTPVATAALKTAEGADAGTVTAFAGPKGTVLVVEGKGWPQGWHGVHLHAVARCEGPGFTSAGAHANHAEDPSPHGLLNTAGPDLGDLQNVHAGADGSAHAEVYAANPGQSVVGLSFLVHANRDDHVSQPIGGAGARIACGVFEAN